MLHIIPGRLFMVLGPVQFAPSLGRRRPALHRWTGRVFLASDLVIGGTAVVMSPQIAIGGLNAAAAAMLFAIIFLFCLVRAFLYIRREKVACSANG
jgi:hypothetical protein